MDRRNFLALLASAPIAALVPWTNVIPQYFTVTFDWSDPALYAACLPRTAAQRAAHDAVMRDVVQSFADTIDREALERFY